MWDTDQCFPDLCTKKTMKKKPIREDDGLELLDRTEAWKALLTQRQSQLSPLPCFFKAALIVCCIFPLWRCFWSSNLHWFLVCDSLFYGHWCEMLQWGITDSIWGHAKRSIRRKSLQLGMMRMCSVKVKDLESKTTESSLSDDLKAFDEMETESWR